MTVHVQIDASDAASLDRLVAAGEFGSREEALHAAIRQFASDQDWLSEVRAKVAEGREQAARGDGVPIDEAFARVRARLGIV